MKKSFFFIFVSFLFLPEISALVKFSNPQINSESKILYTVEHESSSGESYSALFLAEAQKNQKAQELQNSKILTCFPEKMELVSGGSVLQIRNRYGSARYSVADETLSWISREKNLPVSEKGLVSETASASGKWLCFLEKTGAATGRLILKNVLNLRQYVLDGHADFDYKKIPAKWCPGREILLYEKNGAVYFCNPEDFEKNMQMGDDFHRIGGGNINCVSWANSKYFIYIDGGLIYKISADELYTRAVYSSVAGIGAAVGKLPLGFDSRKDRFWCSPAADKIAVVKSNSVISIYRTGGANPENFSVLVSEPFSASESFSGTVAGCDFFWAAGGSGIFWINFVGFPDGKSKSCVYEISENSAPCLSLKETFEDAKNPALSPNRRKIMFASGKHLYIYEVSGWKLLGDINDERFVSYVWNGDGSLIAGGNSTVRKFDMNEDGGFSCGNSRLLFLSSVKSAFWKPGTAGTVTAQSSSSDSLFYDYIPYRNLWLESAADSQASFELMKKASAKSKASQNGKFRVYVGPADNFLFENALYIRNLAGNGETFPVFQESVRKNNGIRRAALAFDALDNADGIPEILSVLNEYKIKATFFLNGEFIRRYPEETRLIANSGHDCASMFFTAADFRGKGFVVDEEFIRRGLARNEDEFFAATGSELSLMWHAPFYPVDDKIKSYGEKSGYKYIDLSRLSLDTATLEGDRKNWYLSAGELVEFYVGNAHDKMIIPVSTGISKGTRGDYLYEKLGLLIEDLLEKGFEFSLARDF